MTTTAAKIVALSRWIDAGNQHRCSEAITWGRLAKVAEEGGEVISAYIGATGQNPRKGVTNTTAEVIDELLDVAVTALGAVEHLDGHNGLALLKLAEKVSAVYWRAGITASEAWDGQDVFVRPDVLTEWGEAYGVRVAAVGEDETNWVALGHVDPLRMIAAIRKVARKARLNDEEAFGYRGTDDGPLTAVVRHTRAVFVDHPDFEFFVLWSEEAQRHPNAVDVTVWSA